VAGVGDDPSNFPSTGSATKELLRGELRMRYISFLQGDDIHDAGGGVKYTPCLGIPENYHATD